MQIVQPYLESYVYVKLLKIKVKLLFINLDVIINSIHITCDIQCQ